MRRRTLLATGLVVASVVVVAGGQGLLSLLEQAPASKDELAEIENGEKIENEYEDENGVIEVGEISEGLAAALQPLVDPSFGGRAQSQDVASLVADLKDKAVITDEGQLDVTTIEMLALTDLILPHNGKYYTQTELDVHTLAFHVWTESESDTTPAR